MKALDLTKGSLGNSLSIIRYLNDSKIISNDQRNHAKEIILDVVNVGHDMCNFDMNYWSQVQHAHGLGEITDEQIKFISGIDNLVKPSSEAQNKVKVENKNKKEVINILDRSLGDALSIVKYLNKSNIISKEQSRRAADRITQTVTSGFKSCDYIMSYWEDCARAHTSGFMTDNQIKSISGIDNLVQ